MYLISLKPPRRAGVQEAPLELDLSSVVRRMGSKSVALISAELGNYIEGDVRQVVLPLHEDFERTVLLSDYLGVDDVVLVPTRPLSVEDFAEMYDLAVSYGKRIYWIFGGPKSPFASVEHVLDIARNIHPRAVYTVVDVVHERSPRKLVSDLVQLGHLVKGMYLSNRARGSRRRTSLFSSNGLINYAKVVQTAILLGLDAKMIVKHSEVDRYGVDLKMLQEIVDTTRSTGKFDKDVVRLVEKIYNEILGAEEID